MLRYKLSQIAFKSKVLIVNDVEKLPDDFTVPITALSTSNKLYEDYWVYGINKQFQLFLISATILYIDCIIMIVDFCEEEDEQNIIDHFNLQVAR